MFTKNDNSNNIVRIITELLKKLTISFSKLTITMYFIQSKIYIKKKKTIEN